MNGGVNFFTLDSRRVLVGTPGTKGTGILYAQDTCLAMNQHHDRAHVLGVWMAKHTS